MSKPAAVSIFGLAAFPAIAPGDDLASAIFDSLDASSMSLQAGDVVVLAQKIVSKAEGRLVELATIIPSNEAITLATTVYKDPRLVELVLRESAAVLRAKPGVLIVEHRLGFVLANAGIDQSNVDQDHGETVLLLPHDPDACCDTIRAQLKARSGIDVPVMIIDSIGRAWRTGTVGTTIGVSGLPGLLDLRGRPDMLGRPLQTSELGFADEVAAAASLVMGQADEGRPVVIVRGVDFEPREARAAELLRPKKMDLFR